MPDDSNGIYNVPLGTLVNSGDTVLPSQHNPWANDSASAISNRFSKDGRAPATGNWNLNTFRITNLGTPTANADAATKDYVDATVGSPVQYVAQTLTAEQQATARSNISAPLRGHIYGLNIANNSSDLVNDIDIASGECASTETNPVLMVLPSLITKRLDAAWSVGSGNGGLDTGSIANTTYHVWIIQRSDTGFVDALFSASATSPTMPTNYDRKRRVASIIREGGSIRAFSQLGDEFLWMNPDLSWSVLNPGTSTVNRTVKVPTGFAFRAKINILLFDTGALASTTAALVTSISQNDTAASATNFSIVAVVGGSTTDPYGASSYLDVRTDNISRVRTNVSASGPATAFRCITMGYFDERGRFQ